MLVGGGFEFLRGKEPVAQDKLQAMAQVIEILDYDLGFLAPEEARILADKGVAAPDGWQVAGEIDHEIVKLNDGHSVAFVYFPVLSKNEQQLSKKSLKAVARLIDEMRKVSDLVIGMSVLGFKAEYVYLKADTSHPDILLGSGPGMGLTGKIEAQGKTVWIRPYSLGKAVNLLEIIEFPVHDFDFKWTEGKNMHALVKGLTEKIALNMEVRSILEPIRSK